MKRKKPLHVVAVRLVEYFKLVIQCCCFSVDSNVSIFGKENVSVRIIIFIIITQITYAYMKYYGIKQNNMFHACSDLCKIKRKSAIEFFFHYKENINFFLLK